MPYSLCINSVLNKYPDLRNEFRCITVYILKYDRPDQQQQQHKVAVTDAPRSR